MWCSVSAHARLLSTSSLEPAATAASDTLCLLAVQGVGRGCRAGWCGVSHRVSDMGLMVGSNLIARSIVWSQARGDAKVNHEAALPRPSSDGDSPRGHIYHHQRRSRGQTSHNLTIPPTAIRGSRPGLLALTTATNTTDSPQAPEGLQVPFHPYPFFPRKILSMAR